MICGIPTNATVSASACNAKNDNNATLNVAVNPTDTGNARIDTNAKEPSSRNNPIAFAVSNSSKVRSPFTAASSNESVYPTNTSTPAIPNSRVSTGRFQIQSPPDVRANDSSSGSASDGSVSDTAIDPNNNNFCTGVNPDNPVRTSTATTGPTRTAKEPVTYTKSEIRNRTLSAEIPTRGVPARFRLTEAPPVGRLNPDTKLDSQSTTGTGVPSGAPTHGVP